VRDYRIQCEWVDLTATFDRFKYPPWGAGGGGDGSPNSVEIIPDNMEEHVLRRGKLARYRLKRGDVACLITGVGGGYGNPLERDQHLIQQDVRNGYITCTQAAEIYRVVIDPNRYSIDLEATQELRNVSLSNSSDP
jgi:N-methylhydantoinase B